MLWVLPGGGWGAWLLLPQPFFPSRPGPSEGTRGPVMAGSPCRAFPRGGVLSRVSVLETASVSRSLPRMCDHVDAHVLTHTCSHADMRSHADTHSRTQTRLTHPHTRTPLFLRGAQFLCVALSFPRSRLKTHTCACTHAHTDTQPRGLCLPGEGTVPAIQTSATSLAGTRAIHRVWGSWKAL